MRHEHICVPARMSQALLRQSPDLGEVAETLSRQSQGSGVLFASRLEQHANAHVYVVGRIFYCTRCRTPQPTILHGKQQIRPLVEDSVHEGTLVSGDGWVDVGLPGRKT